MNVHKLSIQENLKEKGLLDEYSLDVVLSRGTNNISRHFSTYRGSQSYDFFMERKLTEEAASDSEMMKMPGFEISWGYNINQTPKAKYIDETSTRYLHRLRSNALISKLQ